MRINGAGNKYVGPSKERNFNPLRMKRNTLYLKTQFVPRSKHSPSKL